MTIMKDFKLGSWFFASINIVGVVFLTNFGGNCHVWKDVFSSKSYTGQIASSPFESLSVVRSYAQCAFLCLGKRHPYSKCAAFDYRSLEKSCHLHTADSSRRHPERKAMYMFLELGKFLPYKRSGVRFSFYVSNFRRNYLGARTYCFSVGGYLLQFDSGNEVYAAKAFSDGRRFGEYHWLGANDNDRNGAWVNDRDDTPVASGAWWWHKTNSATNGENCAAVNFVGKYIRVYDRGCWTSYFFMCERDVV